MTPREQFVARYGEDYLDHILFVFPDEPNYQSCHGRSTNEYCGGCDMCLAMQWDWSYRDTP